MAKSNKMSPSTKMLTLRVPESLLFGLQVYAGMEQRTINSLVTQLLKSWAKSPESRIGGHACLEDAIRDGFSPIPADRVAWLGNLDPDLLSPDELLCFAVIKNSPTLWKQDPASPLSPEDDSGIEDSAGLYRHGILDREQVRERWAEIEHIAQEGKGMVLPPLQRG